MSTLMVFCIGLDKKKQWRNSQSLAGAGCPPDISHWEISGDLLGKEREGKRENGEEKKENQKREGGK